MYSARIVIAMACLLVICIIAALALAGHALTSTHYDAGIILFLALLALILLAIP